MSYVRVAFDLIESFETQCKELDRLEYFHFLGDWHDERLTYVRKAGLSEESAPAKSIFEDKKRIQQSFSVSLTLSNGENLVGQLRPDGLLISHQSDTIQIDLYDERIRSLLNVLQASSTVIEVESH